MSLPKVLILTTEPVPLPGLPATGAGLRAWGLAFGLRSAGFEHVVLGFAADAVRGRDLDTSAVSWVKTFERAELDAFIRSEQPDALVFQHWGLFRELRCKPACPVAMDLAGPHLLERRLWGSASPEDDLREKLTALSGIDYVVCSGTFQRHYFLPFLVQAGHDPRSSLCPVIPFSLSPGLPEPDPQRDLEALVYAGMFLPWQDPELALRTALEVMDERDKGRLVFIGGPHPGGDVSGGRFDELLEFLSGHPRVERHPVIDFDRFLQQLRRCGAALDIMPRNAERELAFPTRTVTYLWAGLPVVHNDYDELADPIGRERCGWALNPDDPDAIRGAVRRLLSHPAETESKSRRAQELVAERYTWDKTITPLADWCRDPKVRRDKKPVLISKTTERALAAGEEPAPQAQEDARPLPRRPRRQPRVTYAPAPAATDTVRGPWYLSPAVWILATLFSCMLAILFGFVEAVRLITRPRRAR